VTAVGTIAVPLRKTAAGGGTEDAHLHGSDEKIEAGRELVSFVKEYSNAY